MKASVWIVGIATGLIVAACSTVTKPGEHKLQAITLGDIPGISAEVLEAPGALLRPGPDRRAKPRRVQEGSWRFSSWSISAKASAAAEA
jgi:hypothetical protein